MSKYVIELGEDAQIVHSINVTQHGKHDILRRSNKH